MSIAYLKDPENDGSGWKQLSEIYINVPPKSPIYKSDPTNDPRNVDTNLRDQILNVGRLNPNWYDGKTIPQSNAILAPDFTLGNKFEIEFTIKANAVTQSTFTTDGTYSQIFGNHSDRQGFFSKDLFSLYRPRYSEYNNGTTLAIHICPDGDTNHKRIILSRGGVQLVGRDDAFDDYTGTPYTYPPASQHIIDKGGYLEHVGSETDADSSTNGRPAYLGNMAGGKYAKLYFSGTEWELYLGCTSSTIPETTSNYDDKYTTSLYRGNTTHADNTAFDVSNINNGLAIDSAGYGIHLKNASGDRLTCYGSGADGIGTIPTHSGIKINRYTRVAQKFVWGGIRLGMHNVFNGNYNKVKIIYDNGVVKAYLNDVQVNLYRNASGSGQLDYDINLTGQTTGFTSCLFPYIMGGYSYWAGTTSNPNGINYQGFSDTTNRVPKWDAVNDARLDGIKLITYPLGVETIQFDYKLRDGAKPVGAVQTIRDSSNNYNDAEIIYASDMEPTDFWEVAEDNAWRKVEEAWYNDAGTWIKFFDNKLTLTITEKTADYDMFTKALSPSVPIELTVIINAGVIVYSTDPTHGALYCSSNFPSGSKITIINNGEIYGAGGKGGDCPYATGLIEARYVSRDQVSYFGGVKRTLNAGGSASDVQEGQDGGNAIELGHDTTVLNNGIIYGGGGGAGAMRAFRYFRKQGSDNYCFINCGKAGGGGRGYVGGAGGTVYKDVASRDWSKPARIGNNYGALYGSGVSYAKAQDGRFDLAHAQGGTGGYNLDYFYWVSNNYGGSWGEAGFNSKIGNQKSSYGAEYTYNIVANSGKRGFGIDKKGFVLTIEDGSFTDDNHIKGGIYDSTNPPNFEDGTGTDEEYIDNRTRAVGRGNSGGGSCVLSTACYYQDLITSDELMGMIKWRIRKQRKQFLADIKWIGYQVGFQKLASQMMLNKNIANFIYKIIVKDWIKKSQGKGVFPIRTFLIELYCVLMFFLKYKESKKLILTAPRNPKTILKIYKNIISSKELDLSVNETSVG